MKLHICKVLWAAALVLLASVALADSPAYDVKPWLEDLDQAQEAMVAKYANLEWAIFEREADLPGLFADARSRLASTSSGADARAVFDRLARKLGDGHVRFRWNPPPDAAESQVPKSDCAGLGFDSQMRGAPLASLIPGYTALKAGVADEFPPG